MCVDERNPCEPIKELQNIAKITVLDVCEIQVLLQHNMRHIIKHGSCKYLWYFDFLNCAIVSRHLDPIIIIGMVLGFQVAAPILCGKMPPNNKQREYTQELAHANNDPRDVIPHERCIRLVQSQEEA